MRGNLLSLDKVWQKASSSNDPFLPVPTHLMLVWREGLPYWHGLTESDIQQMLAFAENVGELLTKQQTKLKWLKTDVARAAKLYPDLYPAYVPLSVPEGLELQDAVKSVCASLQALTHFICRALVQENIQAWIFSNEANTDQIVIVNAPWFWQSLIVRHVAVAVAKVDYYTFK